MKDYGEKCLFAPEEVDCPLKGIEIPGGLCQACIAQGMYVLTEFMTDMTERSLKLSKINMIFNLLTNFDEEKAKEYFDQISRLATEWKFPWEDEKE